MLRVFDGPRCILRRCGCGGMPYRVRQTRARTTEHRILKNTRSRLLPKCMMILRICECKYCHGMV